MFRFRTNHTTTKNGGTASGRSAVFFAERRKRSGEDFEMMGEDLEDDGDGTLRGSEEDFERMEEESERTETGLLGGRKRDF